MSLVIIWWFVSAHKWFKGPVINVEVRTLFALFSVAPFFFPPWKPQLTNSQHHMLGREENVLDGVEDKNHSDSDAPSVDKKGEAQELPTVEPKQELPTTEIK
jgi:hypothetical protein